MMTPIKSSFLHSVDHDADTDTLLVLFRNGGLYAFHDVPAAIHAELLAAESAGKYFATRINRVFQATKIPLSSACNRLAAPISPTP